MLRGVQLPGLIRCTFTHHGGGYPQSQNGGISRAGFSRGPPAADQSGMSHCTLAFLLGAVSYHLVRWTVRRIADRRARGLARRTAASDRMREELLEAAFELDAWEPPSLAAYLHSGRRPGARVRQG